MKKGLQKIIKSKYFLWLIIFLIIFLLHQFMNFSNDDVTYFKYQLDKYNLFEFLKLRYDIWTSRIIIEGFLVIISRNIYLWRFLDSIMCCLLIYSLQKICFKEQDKKSIILISIICLVFPFLSMKEAGFCATTLNYLWPFPFMLFSFIPFRNIIYKEKINKKMMPLYILALLYVCNQEQSACCIVAFSIIFLIYNIKNKLDIKYPILTLVIGILSFVFILSCPGNAERVIAETINWYPNYVDANILDKIYLGVVSSTSILFNSIFVLWLFSFLLFIFTWKNKSLLCPKIISIIQFIGITLLCLFRVVCFIFNHEFVLFDFFTTEGHVFILNLKCLFLFSFCLAIFLIFIYLLHNLLKKNSILPILILLSGSGTRLIMGFSPTVFASRSRTGIF